MAPIVLSIDIACPPGEVFTLGKQAFVFRGLAGPDADDDDVKLTHDTITNQSGPRFPVPCRHGGYPDRRARRAGRDTTPGGPAQ
jgi:hypothetical protein